ncbi:MAG: hypothetical protein ACKO7P_01415 [Bacteroidota bacterium]
MNGSYILLGDFSGKFMTEQSVSLSSADAFPKDERHHVNVFSGEMKNNTFFHSYNPENYRKFESFFLKNVPNIVVEGSAKGEFVDRRMYTFEELVIIEPKISNIHELNGKTYGEVRGQAYGKTEPNPQVTRVDQDPNTNPIIGGGFVGSGFNQGSELGGCFSEAQNGCMTVYNGCINNLKRILGIILLILLLFWLFKYCDSLKKEDPCARKSFLENEIKKEKKILDSLENELNNNFPNVMESISKLYFYKDSYSIHPFSYGFKYANTGGNLLQLLKALTIFDNKKFEIVGYSSILEKKDAKLRIARANFVKGFFISKGIASNRLTIVDGGVLSEHRVLDKAIYEQYEVKEYNQDMRVIVREKKK